MTILALVRHGQTDWNRAQRIQGRTDVPLNDTGRGQARDAAERLRDGGYGRVVASPLQRAHETARIIAAVLGLEEPETHAGLVERDYGDGEGMIVTDYREAYGTGPVPGAEAPEHVTERALAAVRDIASRDDDVPTIVVAHGGVIRALLTHASGGRLPRPGERVENGASNVFRFVDGELALTEHVELVPAEARG
ncbi:histidine phosphatase family protein [Microbacterium album]|uniref:Phosphatase PhoE n=1 Tax=Microbacterium album TaxID=2053191 RepID=A0A917MMH8_9MICO|nr:histidine phosphatase family protein [Microbacterium album]GGH35090.1 putative phosphatase PhoE [Microbacterium album]